MSKRVKLSTEEIRCLIEEAKGQEPFAAKKLLEEAAKYHEEPDQIDSLLVQYLCESARNFQQLGFNPAFARRAFGMQEPTGSPEDPVEIHALDPAEYEASRKAFMKSQPKAQVDSFSQMMERAQSGSHRYGRQLLQLAASSACDPRSPMHPILSLYLSECIYAWAKEDFNAERSVSAFNLTKPVGRQQLEFSPSAASIKDDSGKVIYARETVAAMCQWIDDNPDHWPKKDKYYSAYAVIAAYFNKSEDTIKRLVKEFIRDQDVVRDFKFFGLLKSEEFVSETKRALSDYIKIHP